MPSENIFSTGDIVRHIQEEPDIIMYISAGAYVMKPVLFHFPLRNEYCSVDALKDVEPGTKYHLEMIK